MRIVSVHPDDAHYSLSKNLRNKIITSHGLIPCPEPELKGYYCGWCDFKHPIPHTGRFKAYFYAVKIKE